MWLKVTNSSGDPIYPVDSVHKKPYELLLVATNNPNLRAVHFNERDMNDMLLDQRIASSQTCDDDFVDGKEVVHINALNITHNEHNEHNEHDEHDKTNAEVNSHQQHGTHCVSTQFSSAPMSTKDVFPANVLVSCAPSRIHSEKPAIISKLFQYFAHQCNEVELLSHCERDNTADSNSQSLLLPRKKPKTSPPLHHNNTNTGTRAVLELFARRLHPGWTSVGNQVLKLQDARLYHTPTNRQSATPRPDEQ
eukprot:m.195599 g.195599  ORF g.195599 m.195599 type:complete len:250 (+) comp13669_c2_seq2:937-1686(+)